ncbi:MAG: adenosylmethionine--8-amino-7-oxononanoate transaminase [Magnetococcales bacterium]|nr:adenosylmethionine--8-amino-7-oxononanoate transaminase [Magnetococcales bacterium]
MSNEHDELVKLDRRHVWHPYTQEQTAPPPIPIASAKGAVLHGVDGREYLDMISSWWVTSHGHAHPAVAKAIADQAQRMEQLIFAGFTHPPAVQLATRLAKVLPDGLSRVFFSDNGSTAVEVGMKMACQYALNRGEQRTRFLTFEGGYHGDTVGAMSAGRSSGFFDAFESMMFQVDTLPFPETWEGDEQVEQKERAIFEKLDRYLEAHGQQCAAALIEPLIQGASGMRICRPAFLRGVAARLKQAGALLIFDEVMTGFGRTGALFASQRSQVTPDIICLSKGLTSGFLPMSVTVCGEPIYEAFLDDTFDRAFAHGHSFTANPLGCAAALASLALFETERTLEKIAVIEATHRERLAQLAEHPNVRHRRLCGSIAALDVVVKDAGYTSQVGPKLKAFFLEQGLLIRPLGHVVYLMPPYCVTQEQLGRAWDAIFQAVDEIP